MLLQVLEENGGFKTLPKVGYDKWDETEPGYNQVVVPNWNINKFISFICENAELKSNKSWKNSMFFYQTLSGEFRFDGFQSMVAREFPIGFDYYPRNNVSTEDHDLNEEFIGLGYIRAFKFCSLIEVEAYNSNTYNPDCISETRILPEFK